MVNGEDCQRSGILFFCQDENAFFGFGGWDLGLLSKDEHFLGKLNLQRKALNLSEWRIKYNLDRAVFGCTVRSF